MNCCICGIRLSQNEAITNALGDENKYCLGCYETAKNIEYIAQNNPDLLKRLIMGRIKDLDGPGGRDPGPIIGKELEP